MTDNNQIPDETGKRALATIVFTDVVNYSERMSKDEDGTLKLVSKDLDWMADLVKTHRGRVIKSTGDGLMIYFDSAVEAVTWAIEIQNGKARNIGEEQPGDSLEHRIGIHIGDVFFKGSDLMGDGVNIASRLEGIAQPGGICISQIVFDTVKNKLPLNAEFIGLQKLKNLDDEIPVHQIDVEQAKVALQKSDTVEETPTQPNIKPQNKTIVIGTVILVIVFAVLLFFVESNRKEQKPVIAEAKSKSIAVLPFHDMSLEKNQEHFCEGMAEELINVFTNVSGLDVAARTSSFRFKGIDSDIPTIGKQLNVDTVLEGSVRKAGNNLRITAQLINVADGFHLWSETYDRELKNVFAIQDEISRAIARALHVELTGEKGAPLPMSSSSTKNIEAYDRYLLGRYHWSKRTEEGLTTAIEQFEKAINLDPNYALAYSGLADAYLVLPRYKPGVKKIDIRVQAEKAVRKALAIDPNLSEAHTAYGFTKEFFHYDYDDAEKEYRRAIELNPKYAPAHYRYSYLLTFTGHFEAALVEGKKALALEPFLIRHNVDLGVTYYFARRFDEAIEQFKRTQSLDASYPIAWSNLGTTYLSKEEYEEATNALNRWAELEGIDKRMVKLFISLAKKHAKTGEPVTYPPKLESVFPLYFYAYLGHKEQTLKLIEQYEKEEKYEDLKFFKHDPVFEFLQSEPRFIALMQKVGL